MSVFVWEKGNESPGVVVKSPVLSGQQLNNFSGSLRPLLDSSVLWRVSWLFNEGQGLLHCCISSAPTKALHVLQQHRKLLIRDLNTRNGLEWHCWNPTGLDVKICYAIDKGESFFETDKDCRDFWEQNIAQQLLATHPLWQSRQLFFWMPSVTLQETMSSKPPTV